MRPEKIEFHNGLPVRAFVRACSHLPYHWHDALEIMQVLKGSVNDGALFGELTFDTGENAGVYEIRQGADDERQLRSYLCAGSFKNSLRRRLPCRKYRNRQLRGR